MRCLRLSPAWGMILALVACKETPPEPQVCDESPGELYERRVAPLFSADNPSTCSQCHAGGVDLAAFLRPDACESMACLQDLGLVDLEHPERSVLLQWIERAQPESELITERVIDEEYAAFESWIEHEAECRACANTECTVSVAVECEAGADLSSPFDHTSDPLDCGRDTMERLFRGTIYEYRSRCTPCHFQEETTTVPAPKWLSRTGDCRVASLATFGNVVAEGYIDIENPSQSPLLLKPLAEFQGGVLHGGHDKFVKSDVAYEAFLYFVERYAACETGRVFEPSGGGASAHD